MAAYIENQNHTIVGYIEGNHIQDRNRAVVGYIAGRRIENQDHSVIAYIEDNRIEDVNHAVCGYINGDKIEEQNHSIIGYINGGATDIQKGAGGIWLLVNLIADFNSNTVGSSSRYSGSVSGSGNSEKPNPLWVLVTHPIGNIVLGLFIAIGINKFSGGWDWNGGYPLVIGIIVTAIGALRLFLRWKKRR